MPTASKPRWLAWLDPILDPLACLPPEEENPNSPPENVLRELEARLRMRLRDALSGDKPGLLRGTGLEFADLREYVPGDDIRKIDWNVLARTLSPHVREYHDEKQLTVWVVVDATPSMQFGQCRAKLDRAVELAGLLGLVAELAQHRLGAFVITNDQPIIRPPKSGHPHWQYVMNTLLEASRQEGPPPGAWPPDLLTRQLEQLAHVVARGSVVFVLSDFDAPTEAWHHPLGRLARRSRVISLMLQDSVETQLPTGLGLLDVHDPETGHIVTLDTEDPAFRTRYAAAMADQAARTEDRLKELGMLLTVDTERDDAWVLQRLLAHWPGGRQP